MKITLEQLRTYLSKSMLKILYYRYQEYLIPTMVIVVSLILFATVVINQFAGLVSSQSQTRVLGEKISVLESNINTLSKINETDQNSAVTAVVSALPEEKEFAGILQAVASASNASGVGVGDYTFSVGDLSKSVISKTTPAITLTLVVQGDALAMKRFLEELSQTTPISNVNSISTSSVSSSVTISFFYKAKTVTTVDYTKPLPILSAHQSETLKQIQEFEAPQDIEFIPPSGSPSGAVSL